MAGLRFTDLQSRPMEFLDCTSLTLDEFQQLVPPFETAFHARMAAWRMDGQPRTARRTSGSQWTICSGRMPVVQRQIVLTVQSTMRSLTCLSEMISFLIDQNGGQIFDFSRRNPADVRHPF
jgi:hypothetical protein